MNWENALLHLKNDVHLKPVVETSPAPQFQTNGNVFFELLESVVSQQLSTKVAKVIFNRFCALFPDLQPHPEQLLAMPPELLRSVGLSAQKAFYLQNIASFSLDHSFATINWEALPDDQIIRLLTEIKGVGPWTAHMVLMFTLGRQDVFPIDDLGIQTAMKNMYSLDLHGKSLKNAMIQKAEAWRPYRSAACWYLWRWNEQQRRIGS